MALETRKLYVGGLPPAVQQDELKEHFGRYGEVKCVRVVRDWETGECRGFAFVEFADDEGPQAALQEKEKANHVFGDRIVDVKRARAKPMRYQNEQSFSNQIPVHSQWYNQSSSNNSYAGNGHRSRDANKVFVGGLRGNITKEDLQSYFEKFGNITDVVVIREGVTQKSRGFGFITFDSKDAMAKVLENTFHDLNGTKIEIKVAIPKGHSYYHDSRQYGPIIWNGSNPPIGYGGLYSSHMQYIFNNHYMVPAPQYMYSPHVIGEYGYMMNGGSMLTRQGPVYTGYGTSIGFDYGSANRLPIQSVDARNENKVIQAMTDLQIDTPAANSISKQEPLDS